MGDIVKKRKIKSKVKRYIVLFILIIIFWTCYSVFKNINWSNEYAKNYNYQEYVSEDSYNLEENPKYDEVSSIKNNKGTIKERLNILQKKDNRIQKIIDNYDSYPEDLLDMLSRNIDMIDFVLSYHDKKGKSYSDTIGEVKKGEIPLLLQYDERWGYSNYGDNILAINGCGPTSLAMIITGLTGNKNITPTKIANFSVNNGFYVYGIGTSWDLMTGISGNFGIKSDVISLDKNIIYKSLENNHPIICSMRAGDFTTTGHFIVLVGIKDDKIIVHDPNSKVRSSMLWDYDRIKNQIRNLWVFYT